MVRLLPSGQWFAAADGQSLMAAADAAGIRLPRSCQAGSCRRCICRLRDGQVRYRIPWPGLSPEEHAAGWILPCVASADTDLLIDLQDPERPST